jgi:DNA processing protein
MDAGLHTLLALIAQPSSRAELTRALLARALDDVARDPTFRPGPRALRLAMRQARALAVLGIHVVAAPDIPPALARARPLPPALFVRGDASLLGRRAVAIVGARDASPGPTSWAARVAGVAARAGLLVVSGGARGIDAAAHRAALEIGQATVVYLGVQADRIYPAFHRRLFERVLTRGGALVSEHPPLTPAFAPGHATRNRFIAAQADVVVVAEAGEGSGSLGTAAFARRLGIPVLVPPTAVGGERRGIDTLLEAGAARELARDELLLDVLGLTPIAAAAPGG